MLFETVSKSYGFSWNYVKRCSCVKEMFRYYRVVLDYIESNTTSTYNHFFIIVHVTARLRGFLIFWLALADF